MLKRYLLTTAVAVAGYSSAMGQTAGFCEAINNIMADAPHNFDNIKGKQMDMSMHSTMWASSIKIPGTVGYRIVESMGLFYEGALIQTTDKTKLPPLYAEYKKKLQECLTPLGYKMSTQENVVAGLSNLKKVVFMKDIEEPTETDDISKLPPHITMEADYHKQGGFTLVIFIFQH